MKIRKILQLGVSTLLSTSSLLALNLSTAHAATATWTGAGGDNLFSTAANWQGNAAPISGDILTFPASAARHQPQNDLSNVTFPLIQFTGGTGSETGYDITGNEMTVGNINDASNMSNSNMIRTNLTVGSSSLFQSNNNSRLVIGYPGSVGANTLTISSGSVLDIKGVTIASAISGVANNTALEIADANNLGNELLADSPSFAGNLILSDGNLYLNGQFINTPINVNGGKLMGTGAGGLVSINSASHISPGNSPGCITVAQIAITGTYDAELGGSSTPCTDYDQLIVTNGQIVLTDATLNVSFYNGFTPTAGQSFTIINNTFGGPISNTFNGLAEGSTFTVGNTTFAITYKGNGANDVVITAQATQSASNSPASSTTPGTPNTGMRLVRANGAAVLGISTASALALLYISRRKNIWSK